MKIIKNFMTKLYGFSYINQAQQLNSLNEKYFK